MAFTSLFSSLPNKEYNTKPSDSSDRFQQDEWREESVNLENDEDAQFRKKPMERNPKTVCRKRKKKAKKRKLHKDEPQLYKDFDSEARDYAVMKCDYEQPSFQYSEQLGNCSRRKAGEDMSNVKQKSGWKHPRPGEASEFNKRNEKGKQQQKNGQWEQQRLDNQTRGRAGSSAKRAAGFGRQSGRRMDAYSSRGGRGSNGNGEKGNRGRGRAKRSGFHNRYDWSKRGTDRSHRGGQQFLNNRRSSLDSSAATWKRNMTKEFKDQNAIEIDGRLICRHFLKGKCVKGEDCQLEHALDVNYTINEVCKFYIQGFCLKGESCIYMHKSFPCKFFHTYFNCKQGDQCRFSHEPLTELTKQLLESALERDKDSQEPKPEELEPAKETQPVIDIFLNPLRPNFYNSSSPYETNAEEIPLCQNALSAKVTEMETDHPSDSSLCPDLTSVGCKEPVSYSVEAMLGSHKPLNKPYRGFFSPSGNQSSTLQPTQAQPDVCLSDLPLNSTCSKENFPCSVETTLGFRKPIQRHFCKPFSESVTETFTPLHTQTQSDPHSTIFVSSHPINSTDPHLNKSLACSEEADFGPQKLVGNPICNLFSGPIFQSSHHLPTNTQQGTSCTAFRAPGSDPSGGGKNLASYSVKILPQPNKPMEKPFCSLSSGSLNQMSCKPPSQRSSNNPLISSGSEVTASRKKTENNFCRLFAGPISHTSTRQTRVTLRNPPNTTFGASDSIKSSDPHPVCKKRMSSVEAASEFQPFMGKPFCSLFAAPLCQTTPPNPLRQSSPHSALNRRGQNDSLSVEPLLELHNPLEKPLCSLFAGPIDQTTTPHPSQNQPDPPRAVAQCEVPTPKAISRLPNQTPSVLKTLFLHLSPCRQEGEQWSSNGSKDPGKQSQKVDEMVVEDIKQEVGEIMKVDIEEFEEEVQSEPEECGLRVKPMVIPLEPLVHYMPFSDPRHPLQVNITLPTPTFSQDVVWSPEDRAPVPPLSRPRHPQPFVPLTAPSCESASGPAAGLGPQPSPQNINSHNTAGEHLTLSGCSGRNTVQVDTPGIHNLPVLAVAQMTRPKFDIQRPAGQIRSNSGNLSDRKTLKDLFKNLDPTSTPFGQ